MVTLEIVQKGAERDVKYDNIVKYDKEKYRETILDAADAVLGSHLALIGLFMKILGIMEKKEMVS